MEKQRWSNKAKGGFLLALFAGLAGCNPTVRVEAPKEPIVIDLNINIEHHIKVQIDKDVQQLMQKEKDLF